MGNYICNLLKTNLNEKKSVANQMSFRSMESKKAQFDTVIANVKLNTKIETCLWQR